MANKNWNLHLIVDQAFDTKRYPRNPWENMLDLIAAHIRGGPQAQNRAIGYFLNASERTVRRWRNERVMPLPRDRRLIFEKTYMALIDRSPSGISERVFFPIGFQFVVPEWLDAGNLDDEADKYEAAESLYVKEVPPPPSIKPIAITTSMRAIEAFLQGGLDSVENSGASQVRIEKAVDPMKQWPTRVIETYQGKTREIKVDAAQGYIDFFNPYDIPTMNARLLALIKLATSGSFGSASSLSNLLTRLHAILRVQYGFYSPGNSRLPHANLDHTAPYMRWLERMISLAVIMDQEIAEAQEIKRERRNKRKRRAAQK